MSREQVREQKQVKDGAQGSLRICKIKINSKAFTIFILTICGL